MQSLASPNTARVIGTEMIPLAELEEMSLGNGNHRRVGSTAEMKYVGRPSFCKDCPVAANGTTPKRCVHSKRRSCKMVDPQALPRIVTVASPRMHEADPRSTDFANIEFVRRANGTKVLRRVVERSAPPSLGMSKRQALRLVIGPQPLNAVRLYLKSKEIVEMDDPDLLEFMNATEVLELLPEVMTDLASDEIFVRRCEDDGVTSHLFELSAICSTAGRMLEAIENVR